MQIINYVKRGETQNLLRVFLYKDDAASSPGSPFTGLDHDSSGLSIAIISSSEAATTVYTSAPTDDIEDIATLGSYVTPTSGKVRFKEVDAANHPGVYELQFEDNRFVVVGAKYIDITVFGVVDLAPAHVRVELESRDALAQVQFDTDVMTGSDGATLSTATITTLWETALTETYAADGIEGTASQILYMIQQFLLDADISSTTLTIRQLDGTTAAATVLLNDVTNPTDKNRVT